MPSVCPKPVALDFADGYINQCATSTSLLTFWIPFWDRKIA